MLAGGEPAAVESMLVRTLGPRDGCELAAPSAASTSPLVDTDAAPPPTIMFELESAAVGLAPGLANSIGP